MNWFALFETALVAATAWLVGNVVWTIHLDRKFRRLDEAWRRVLCVDTYHAHYPASVRLCYECHMVADRILRDFAMWRSPVYFILHWWDDYGIGEAERAVEAELAK